MLAWIRVIFGGCVLFIILWIVVWLVALLISKSGEGSAVFATVIVILIFLIAIFGGDYLDKVKETEHQKILDDLKNRVVNILKNDKQKIIKAYRNTVSEDVFGDVNYDKFNKVMFEYLKKRIPQWEIDKLNEMSDNDLNFREYFDIYLSGSLGPMVKSKFRKALITGFSLSMTPRDYELFCEDLLKKAGWNASATKASGDQGVDIEAERNGVKIVAQCKKFKSPVGNKAVQEVVAGIKHYGANYGVVIAPSGFTESARILANSNDIKLIHHDEITSL